MKSITVFPKDDQQGLLIAYLLKEMNIPFVRKNTDDTTLYSEEEFYAKIDKSIQQFEEGKVKDLSKEKQKELLGL